MIQIKRMVFIKIDWWSIWPNHNAHITNIRTWREKVWPSCWSLLQWLHEITKHQKSTEHFAYIEGKLSVDSRTVWLTQFIEVTHLLLNPAICFWNYHWNYTVFSRWRNGMLKSSLQFFPWEWHKFDGPDKKYWAVRRTMICNHWLHGMLK